MNFETPELPTSSCSVIILFSWSPLLLSIELLKNIKGWRPFTNPWSQPFPLVTTPLLRSLMQWCFCSDPRKEQDKNTGVSSHSLLWGTFFGTQGWNLDLLHCRQILYCLEPARKSRTGSRQCKILVGLGCMTLSSAPGVNSATISEEAGCT